MLTVLWLAAYFIIFTVIWILLFLGAQKILGDDDELITLEEVIALPLEVMISTILAWAVMNPITFWTWLMN